MSKFRLLISDVESRKSFDIVNIYQRHLKHEVVLCAGKDTRVQLPLIYLQKIHKLRYVDYATFEADLDKICASFKEDKLFFIPASERTIVLFYQYLEKRGSAQFLHALPEEHIFHLARNKGAFQDFCEQRGFPVPKSYKTETLSQLIGNFRPVVYKPKHGQGSVGIRYFDTLDSFQSNPPKDFENYILQEKVICSNQVTGSFYLCNKGRVISAHCHQRLRTFPIEGGVTVFSQSTFNEDIIKIGSELLASLEWHGVAMIEFMFDEPTQEWRIIELNPRLWGSVILTEFNDSKILSNYIQLALKKEVGHIDHQPNSVYIRWFFPFEVLNFLKRNISFSEFINLKRLKVCYINWTYSTYYRASAYWLYFAFNFSSVKRFIKKLAR